MTTKPEGLIGSAVTFKSGRSGTTYRGVVRKALDKGRVLVESFEDGSTVERRVFASACTVAPATASA
jgi:hypothetical protein